MNWYYMNRDNREGPVNTESIMQLISAGRLDADSLVWNKSLGREWVKIADVKELSGLLTVPAEDPSPLSTPQTGEKQEVKTRKKGGCARVAGIGCLTSLLILGAASFFIFRNIRSIGANVASGAIKAAISESGLSSDEQAAIMQPVNELAADFKNGSITIEEMGKIFETVMNGPLTSLIMVKAFEKKFIETADMADIQKGEAMKTVSRFAEGYSTGRITDTSHMEHISRTISVQSQDAQGEPSVELKEALSPEELKLCLDIMKSAADTAGVPDRQYTVDIGQTLSDAIRKAKADLGK